MTLDYTSRLQKIEAVLRQFLPPEPSDDWFNCNFFADRCEFTGSRAARELADALLLPGLDLFSRGGKRWRPLLALLVCESLGGGDAVLPLSPLLEFCHNASLIHDDIEDNSAERRGKPAIHLLYGTDTAINSACFLYFLPLSAIDCWDAPPEAKLRLYSLWAREMRALHLGQSMDIAWHRNAETIPSIDDYHKMCALKTGVLARLAVNAGCIAARLSSGDAGGARQPLLPTLEKAAQNLGLGFQILDDVKNLSEGIPGKMRGDDIIEGKKSLPVLLYLHGASSNREAERRLRLVVRAFTACKSATPDTLPPEARELISELDAALCLEKARYEGRRLLSEAESAFSMIVPNGKTEAEARELLLGFSRLIG